MSDVTSRLTATLADRYAIEREIGAGGMATVYLAQDLKHARKVALKVLRPELAAILGSERFLSEIRVAAGLQHPHLLPLFDSGEADGLLYYVMPFVEGESLRARLDREGQLPIDDAICIAAGVAEGLDHAHRHGVVHRDLKPENILLQDGQPLVADFGIAVAVSKAGGERLTQTGLSLGTPAYMSPEQASGDRRVDPRSDIYSLAAVTYEMLVGEPPHVAATTQALVARVLIERPRSVRAQRDTVPEQVDAAIQRGLEKLPADRWKTASEFADALGPRPGVAMVPPDAPFENQGDHRSVSRRWRTWSTITTAAMLTAIVAAIAFATSTDPRPSLVIPLTLGDAEVFSSGVLPEVALSHDGSRVAFHGVSDGTRGIFVRALDETDARLVVEGIATGPVFSPDGRWLLFVMDDGLWKVPVQGGPPESVVEEGEIIGASWGDQGEILYAARDGALRKVSAEGGTPVVVATPDPQRQHLRYQWPSFLPGGRHALITLWKGSINLTNAELGMVSLRDGEVVELGIPGTGARYTPDGHLVYGQADGSLVIRPFSARRRRALGTGTTVLEGVSLKNAGGLDLALSPNGTIAYVAADPGERRLVAVDRRGATRPLLDRVRAYAYPRVSPDGRLLSVTIGPPFDIWMHELSSPTLTQLTHDGASQRSEFTADGGRVLYLSSAEGGGDIRWQPADGSGEPAVFYDGEFEAEISVGPPGTYLAARGANGIGVAPLDSPQSIRSIPHASNNPRVSPDGRMLAYVSSIQGRREVFVRLLPGPDGYEPVSTNGGDEPVWSRDGTELFYRAPGHFMVARIARTPELSVLSRDTLFEDVFARPPNPRANYDVLPSGELVAIEGAGGPPAAFVIVNWLEGARRRAAEAAVR